MIRGSALEFKGKKTESLPTVVVPKELNENDNEGEEAEELEAMVGEVMKRNRTEKLESITSSEVASDDDEDDEEEEEEEEEVEVSLPDAQNLDLDVENAQPVFRRQWSGVLPKMTEGLYWLLAGMFLHFFVLTLVHNNRGNLGGD